MNKLIVISGVSGFLDDNGVAQLHLEGVARGLGFTQEKNGVEYVRWETVNGYLEGFGFSQQAGKGWQEGFIPENIFYRLAMKAKNETAEKFQAIVADEILPAIRKTGTYSTSVKLTPQPRYRARMISTAVKDVDATAKQLMKLFAVKNGIAYAAAVNMVESTYQIDMAPVKKMLPAAEHETGFLNAGGVGEKLGCDARMANHILAKNGLQSKTDGKWRLTDAGKKYAEEIPYNRNGHSGYQIQWNESVIETLIVS